MMPPWANGAAAVAGVAITAGVLLFPHGGGAPSSVGAGVQVGPVLVTMAPGTTARARLKVRDTGSGTETLAILGGRETSDGRIVTFPWVRRASVTTAPEIWRTVVFTIAVPAGTAPGQYRRLVGDGAAPAGNPGGAAFGAEIFTNLIITVVPSGTSGHATRGNDHVSSTRTGA